MKILRKGDDFIKVADSTKNDLIKINSLIENGWNFSPKKDYKEAKGKTAEAKLEKKEKEAKVKEVKSKKEDKGKKEYKEKKEAKIKKDANKKDKKGKK